MSQHQSTTEGAVRNLLTRQRLFLSKALTRFANWVSPSGLGPVASVPERRKFLSQRADVRAWVANADPKLLRELELDPSHGGRFEAVLHSLPHLPSEAVIRDFLFITPDWRELHPKHAAVLLRRLCTWDFQQRDYDTLQYTQVMEFFLQIKRLVYSPPPWAKTVQQAKLFPVP